MKKLLVFLPLASITFSVQAEKIDIDLKPGYWQNTVQFSEQSIAKIEQTYQKEMQQAVKDLREQFAAMPAEQREMMEGMLKAQGMEIKDGQINMPSAGLNIRSDGIKSKNCVTEEDISNGTFGASNEPDCETKIKQINKSTLQINEICKGEDASSMSAKIELEKPTRYTGSGKMTQVFEGQEMVIDVKLEGTWLAKDCGISGQ